MSLEVFDIISKILGYFDCERCYFFDDWIIGENNQIFIHHFSLSVDVIRILFEYALFGPTDTITSIIFSQCPHLLKRFYIFIPL